MDKINPQACQHMATARAEIKGSFSDEDIRVHFCMSCGTPMFMAPVIKFKHNPEAQKFFRKMAEEFDLSLPTM